jgi:hypothetical protein
MLEERGDDGDALARGGFADGAPAAEERLLRLRRARKKHAHRLDPRRCHGVVKGRYLQGVDRGIDHLRRRGIAREVLVQAIPVTEKRVREDVLLRAVPHQERLVVLLALRARRTERRHEDARLGRRGLVHVDAAAEQELDDGSAPRERGQVQRRRRVRRGREGLRRALQQRAQRRGARGRASRSPARSAGISHAASGAAPRVAHPR